MADSKRDAYITWGYQVDQASVNAVSQAAAATEARMVALQKSTVGVGDAATKTANTLKTAFSQVGTALQADQKMLDDLRKSVDNTKPNASANTVRAQGFHSAGMLLNSAGLGDVARPVQELGNVALVLEEVGKSGAVASTALGLVVVAATVFTGGLELIRREYEKNTATIKIALAANDAYYKAIESGTTENLRKQLDAAQKQKTIIDAQLANTAGAAGGAFTSAQKAYGDLGARIMFAAGNTGLYGDTLKETGAKTDELRKKQQEYQGQIDGLTQAMQSSGVAANDAAEAEKKLSDARIKQIDENIARDVKQSQLLRDASSKQVATMIDDAEALIRTIEDNKQSLAGLTDPASVEKLKALNEQEEKEKQTLDWLRHTLQDVALKREREAEAIKKQEAALKAASEAITKENEALVSIYEKHAAKVVSLEQTNLDQRAAIEEKYQNALVAAAQNAVEAATAALQKLEAQRNDLAETLSRDIGKSEREAGDKALETRIKAQRQERDDLTAHLRRLQDIQNQSHDQEQMAIWNRDALQLLQLRQSKTAQMDQENLDYQRRREDAQRALSDQADDQRRADGIQRRERLIAYQQANEDAKKQYEREMEAASTAKEKAIRLAIQARDNELRIQAEKNAKALELEKAQNQAEIRQATLTGQARTDLLKAEMEAARRWAAEMVGQTANNSGGGGGGGGGHSPSPNVYERAFGGTATPGNIYQVNERGTESFEGTSFPPGLGLFLPARAGTVRPSTTNNNTHHIEVPIVINDATDPQRVGQIVGPVIEERIIHALHIVIGDRP